MSLINDALRRASQEDRSQVEPPPLPKAAGTLLDPALEPAEPPPISPWPSLIALLAVVLVVGGGLGAGGWFLWKSRQAKRVAVVAASSNAKTGARTTSPPKPLTSLDAPTASAASAPSDATARPATNAAVVPQPVTPPVVVPNAAVFRPLVPVKWPQLKLQGIYYKPPRSSVLINSKTLFVDDEIQGVRVADIGTYFVTITMDGQSNTLVLR